MRCLRVLSLALMLVCALAAGSVWAQGSQSTNDTRTLENDTTTGTLLNGLAKMVPGGTGGRSKLVKATASDTAINLYVVSVGGGTTGSSMIVLSGDAACLMDATNAAGTGCGGSGCGGKPVVISPTDAPKCHVQASPPTSGMVIGTLADDATTVNQLATINALNQNYSAGGTSTGTLSSVGLVMPATEFSVASSPVTGSSGVFTVTWIAKAANCVMAGPTSGASAPMTCRPMVPADLPAGTASGSCTGDLGGTFPACTVLKASSTFAIAGDNAITLSTDVNDYNPTGFSGASRQRLTCTVASCTITGFAAQANGDIKELCNVGTNPIILANSSSSSAAANQLLLVDNVTIVGSACHPIQYDGSSASPRWRSYQSSVPDYLRLRPFSLTIGDPGAASPVLASDNDSPVVWTNMFGRPAKIVGLACRGNAGATTILPITEGGSGTSILSSSCTCGSGTFTICTLNGTPTINPTTRGTGGATCPSAPCRVSANLDVADGTTKQIVINVEALLQ